MLAPVPSMIVCGTGMGVCSRKTIADVAPTIVSVAEKIESLSNLIAGRMEILVSQSSAMTDDPEIIV